MVSIVWKRTFGSVSFTPDAAVRVNASIVSCNFFFLANVTTTKAKTLQKRIRAWKWVETIREGLKMIFSGRTSSMLGKRSPKVKLLRSTSLNPAHWGFLRFQVSRQSMFKYIKEIVMQTECQVSITTHFSTLDSP